MSSNLFYLWLASGVFFLLIEILTVTFYGLSISIASFVLAAYVYFTGDADVTIAQGFILAIVSGVFAYFFPKWFNVPKNKMLKSGLDAHLGHTFHLERVGNDWKVKIDGVDYLVDDDCVADEFAPKQKVRLDGHKGGVLDVTVVK